MKKHIWILLIFIILQNCFQSKTIELVKKDRSKKEAQTETNDEENSEVKNSKITSDQYVYLFFDKGLFQKKVETKDINKEPEVKINPNDYKIVAEWRIGGGTKKIKLRNIKTMEEFIVTEGSDSGKIILVEKELMYYTFMIENQIVKIKR